MYVYLILFCLKGGLCTCQLFWSQRHEILILKESEFPKIIRLFAKISGNFRGRSEEFRSSEVSLCVWDGLKKNNLLGFFFPSRSVNLGLKHDLHGPFCCQIGSSLHFLW